MGIFLVSLVIGMLVAVVVLKVNRSRKKEKLVCITVYISNSSVGLCVADSPQNTP